MPCIGRDVPHESGAAHVSGTSIYVDDMPLERQELWVDFVGSTLAHGKLLSVNLEEIQAVPGVVATFTHRDLPGHKRFGPIFQDEILLVESEAHFMGHPIVVIAAESRRALQAAKKVARVQMDPLPPIFSIDAAKAQHAFIGPLRRLERGNIDEAFSAADHVLEGRFISGGQEHFYLESQAVRVVPGEYGSLTVYTSNQHPSETQREIAALLGLKQNQVVCIVKRMGGGFGGKECQATHPAAMAALVAHHLRRPARLIYTKDDDMQTTGKRHPFQNDYRVAFSKDGEILGLDVQLFSDGGCAADLSTSIMARAMTHVDNAYYIPNLRVTGQVCRTNTPSNTALRGFGGPQGVITIENIIEEVAHVLGKDPFAIRTQNCYGLQDRNVTHYGQVIRQNLLPEILQTLAERANYHQRMDAVVAFNANSQTHLKGLSLTPVKYGIAFNTQFLNQGNALVNLFLDGSVQVSTGGTEMGQGLQTKIAQLVADAFQIPIQTVRVMATSTEKNINTSATAASSGFDINGAAASNACDILKDRLLPFFAEVLVANTGLEPSESDIQWTEEGILDGRLNDSPRRFADLVALAYQARIDLGARGFHATPGLSFDWESGVGNPFLYYTTGCAVSEVLIDRLSGELTVLQSDILMDIGRSMNPGIDRGQITGAFIQGMGWLTTEELKYAEDGRLLSHSPTTYKIPNVRDIPKIFTVDWVENTANTQNVRQSKAVGEPPLLLAISVWTAIKHALGFVSKGKVPKLAVPATQEEILMRLTEYAESDETDGMADESPL